MKAKAKVETVKLGTTPLRTRSLSHDNYAASLESFYSDLLIEEKAGRISETSHQMLDTFLLELRELVSEVQGPKMAKAA